jgi:4-hydroxybenzoate polyprenyltransferase
LKQSFIAILLMLRWPNLLITALTLVISYYFLLLPASLDSGLVLRIQPVDMALLCISTLLIMMGAYVINDWMDVESDLHNEKGGRAKFIPRTMLLSYYTGFSLGGLTLALWLCYRLEALELWSIHLTASLLLLLYSMSLKSSPLAGNIAIAILSGSIPLMPLLFDQGFDVFEHSAYIGIYFLAFFGFLITLIRELIKDMEDEVGDRKSGLATFPVIFGMEAARWTSFFFFMLFMVLMMAMLYLLAGRDIISLLYLTLFVLSPMLWLSYKLTLAESKKDYHSISRNLKIVMLLGIGFAVVYHFSYT